MVKLNSRAIYVWSTLKTAVHIQTSQTTASQLLDQRAAPSFTVLPLHMHHRFPETSNFSTESTKTRTHVRGNFRGAQVLCAAQISAAFLVFSLLLFESSKLNRENGKHAPSCEPCHPTTQGSCMRSSRRRKT